MFLAKKFDNCVESQLLFDLFNRRQIYKVQLLLMCSDVCLKHYYMKLKFRNKYEHQNGVKNFNPWKGNLCTVRVMLNRI